MRARLGIMAALLAATALSGAEPAGPSWPQWVDLSNWNNINEGYRHEFNACDANNRFRGIQLPRQIGARYYYGCSSDPSSVTALRRLVAAPGLPHGAIAFTSKLAVDLDGSWYACNTPGHTDQCSTSLTLRDSEDHEVGVSSDSVPYVVILTTGPTRTLSREFQNLTGVHVGDFGVVLTATQAIPVIVGDGGPFSKLGEGSIALHRRLGTELCATKNDDGSCRTVIPHIGSNPGPLVTVIFPGSRVTGLTPANIAQRTNDEGLRYWRSVAALLGRQP
jgi:hypothetical protein